jgi:5-methylthioadenosine/S-adenosylhomocysteine deaminase
MSCHPIPADTLIDARWVIPVEPAGAVLNNHSVVLTGGIIQDVLPTDEAHTRYAPRERFGLDEHVLIPGLVNLHTHAAMTLMRGLRDDVSLMEWLNRYIWPAELQYASADMVRDGTLLACAEMMRGGVTCFNDMYFFPEAAADAVLRAGMRAALGIIVVEFQSPYASDASDYLAKGLAMRDSLRDEQLLSFCIAPHAPYSVSDDSFERIATYAAELDLPVHLHLHETLDEVHESFKFHNERPIARMHRLGLLGPNLIAVHAVHVDATEIAQLAEEGVHVAHCPSSNLKLASGIAPVAAMRRGGVNVGLGTDSAASNNRLDMFAELRLAALLAKGNTGEATALPAQAALEMATLNGARALGLEDRIGSLHPGKRGDIVAVDFGALELAPCYDPLSHVVYAAGREHVSHVWVDGELRIKDREIVGLDPAELKAKARYWREKIQG